MKPGSLEEWKEMFRDDSLKLSVGVVKQLELTADRATLRALVSIFPEELEMVCRVAWESTGPDAGVYMFPSVGDMVMVGFLDGEEDEAFVIRRLSSAEDTIPATAEDGSLVMRSLAGKKSWTTSDTRINLSRGDAEPTENLVIGQVFKTTYIDHLSQLIDALDKLATQRETDAAHIHIGIFGVPVNIPTTSGTMTAEKALLDTIKGLVEDIKADVEAETILSDVSFTEK